MRTFLVLLLLTAPVAADGLDRAAISEGIAKVKPKIVACGDKSSASGTVKIEIGVAPAGTVTSIAVKATPDEVLGECVAEAIKTATFRATKDGGKFTYPFIFDNPLPDAIDRQAITDGIAQVKPQIMQCAGKPKGTVKVKVVVIGSGTVSNIEVLTTPDPALGACVAGAIQKATFRKTKNGGTFSYPFVF